MLQAEFDLVVEIVRKNSVHNLDIGPRHEFLKKAFGITDLESASQQQLQYLVTASRLALEYGLAKLPEQGWMQDLADQTLRLANDYFTSEAEPEQLQAFAQQTITKCDDFAWRNEGNTTIALGYACAHLLWECVAFQELYGEITNQTTDWDIEPSMNDTAFHVAAMVSAGGPWDADSDKEQRREFWETWLTKVFDFAKSECGEQI